MNLRIKYEYDLKRLRDRYDNLYLRKMHLVYILEGVNGLWIEMGAEWPFLFGRESFEKVAEVAEDLLGSVNAQIKSIEDQMDALKAKLEELA